MWRLSSGFMYLAEFSIFTLEDPGQELRRKTKQKEKHFPIAINMLNMCINIHENPL